MTNIARIMLASALVLVGTSAMPFEDGFEARASSCIAPAKIDLGDGLRPVLLKPGTLSCVDGDTLKTQCVMDGVMCKREAAPLPPPAPGPCDARPAGWTYLTDSSNRALTWDKVFGFPFDRTPSYLTPVGSASGRTRPYDSGKPITGKIIALPVTVLAKNTTLSVAGSQPIPDAGYGGGQKANSVAVTVTACKGDIAVRANTCGALLGSEFKLTFGPTATLPACRFPTGTPVWVNVAFPDSRDPLNPAKNGCDPRNSSGGVKCDRNFSAR